MVARFVRIEEVRGSIPRSSTTFPQIRRTVRDHGQCVYFVSEHTLGAHCCVESLGDRVQVVGEEIRIAIERHRR